MPNYNLLILIGHTTRDLELKYTPSGSCIGSGGIAFTKKWKGKDNQGNERTSFFDFKVFGTMAENFQKFVKKGNAVQITGEIEQEQWQDKNTGQNRSKVVVNVHGFTLLPQTKKRQEVQVGGDDRGTQFQSNPDNDEDVPF